MHIYRSVATTLPLCLVLLLALTHAASSQVVAVPEAEGVVEFIGLRTWKADQLVDALRRLDSLEKREADRVHSTYEWSLWNWERHLHDPLGFPEVATVIYPDSSGSFFYWVISVVEPVDSLKIRYNVDPTRKPAPSLDEWGGLDTVPLWQPEQWQLAVESFGYIASGKVEQGRAFIREKLRYLNGPVELSHVRKQITPGEIEQLWVRIGELLRPDHKRLALRVLATDSSVHNRAVAAAVLGNFSHDDAVWNALIAAQLDQWGLVSSTARRTLVGFAGHLTRPINWIASSEVITAILDGSQLEGLTDLLIVLEATEISPTLAPFILPGHEELLLAYLAAHHERERVAAHRFLVRMAGRDLGRDPAVWRKWIAGLKKPADR